MLSYVCLFFSLATPNKVYGAASDRVQGISNESGGQVVLVDVPQDGDFRQAKEDATGFKAGTCGRRVLPCVLGRLK